MRGLVVPLEVVLPTERALAPGLVARELALALVDGLDVDLQVMGPSEH